MPGFRVAARADLNALVAPYLYARTPPSHTLTINPTRNSLKPMQYRDDPLEVRQWIGVIVERARAYAADN